MKLLLFFLACFFACNILDAFVSRRHIFSQLSAVTMLTAPLNAAVHIGTPSWLKRSLQTSPILKPTKKLFSNLSLLRSNFSTIAREALAAFDASKPIKNDLYFRGIADSGWKRFYIKWYGPTDPLALQVCPETCALLQKMPEVHLGMFSILMPGSVIPPHFGPARMCLRYHLGILTPNDSKCSIQVGDDSYAWKDGDDVMFDDTVVHKVSNKSDKPRIILFLDIERPQTGIFKSITRSMIRHLGPITTRTNDGKEKVISTKTLRNES